MMLPTVHVVGLSPAVDELVEMPKLVPGQHHRGSLTGRRAAGKATNVACTLARLGVPCVLHGCVGRGELELFEQRLAAARVRSCLVGVEAVTRRSTTLLTGRHETHLTYPSFPVGRSTLATIERRLVATIGAGDYVAMAGAPPAGSSLAGIKQLFRAVRKAGARWFTDSSGAVLEALVGLHPDGVRLNEKELLEWHKAQRQSVRRAPSAGTPAADLRFGLRVSPEAARAVGALLAAGVGQVMVSFGARGALLATAEVGVFGQVRAPGRSAGGAPGPTDAALTLLRGRRHTVGAGDAQLGGWLWAILSHPTDRRWQLQDAVAVATAKLRHPLPGTVRLRDVRAARSLVRLSPSSP